MTMYVPISLCISHLFKNSASGSDCIVFSDGMISEY
jgi:hypothetical protein